jgi:hypothetical protein
MTRRQAVFLAGRVDSDEAQHAGDAYFLRGETDPEGPRCRLRLRASANLARDYQVEVPGAHDPAELVRPIEPPDA